MTFTSYAQAREDVLLWRALAHRVHHSEGFYIDVGAYDPDTDSVTKVFYERGWRGINIEAVEAFYNGFVELRPNDINIRAAASDRPGELIFHEIVGHQLSTASDTFADRHEHAGFQRRSYTVPALTLTQICEEHAKDRTIHFLKIDVEGHEAAVIHGMDFSRFRPWILVIEATEPNKPDALTHDQWEPDILLAGYRHVHTHLPNRYYVANERPELASAFSLPVDDYVPAPMVARIRELEAKLSQLGA